MSYNTYLVGSDALLNDYKAYRGISEVAWDTRIPAEQNDWEGYDRPFEFPGPIKSREEMEEEELLADPKFKELFTAFQVAQAEGRIGDANALYRHVERYKADFSRRAARERQMIERAPYPIDSGICW